MKKILVLIIAVFTLMPLAQSQQKLVVYTKNDNAKFRIYLNGDKQNNFPDKRMEFDIDTTVIDLVINFADSLAADIHETVYFLDDQTRTFEIKEKPKLLQKAAITGRKIGKNLSIGDHSLDNQLIDKFYLVDRTKDEFFDQPDSSLKIFKKDDN